MATVCLHQFVCRMIVSNHTIKAFSACFKPYNWSLFRLEVQSVKICAHMCCRCSDKISWELTFCAADNFWPYRQTEDTFWFAPFPPHTCPLHISVPTHILWIHNTWKYVLSSNIRAWWMSAIQAYDTNGLSDTIWDENCWAKGLSWKKWHTFLELPKSSREYRASDLNYW